MKALNKKFGDRVWFVGLQGSYGRGEATQTSDIDVVVFLGLKNGGMIDFNKISETLFTWSKNWIEKTK